MLMRFDPFRELDRLTDDVWGGRLARPTTMAMDAYRHGDEFVVRFDLPGISPDSVELTVEKNVLTVSGERGWQPEDGVQVLVAERPQGRFSRQVFLGESLDTEHITATYEHGVLTVTIPVEASAKPRRVEIATAPARGVLDAESEQTAISSGQTA